MNSLEGFAKYVSPTTSSLTMNPMASTILTDMEAKSYRFVNSLNDVLYDTSNEPSLGFFRVQEHVRKSIPTLIEKKTDLDNFQSRVKGASFDLDYSIDVVSKMAQSDSTLENVKTLLTDSLYSARQLNIRNSKTSEPSNSPNSKQPQKR